MIRKYVWLSIAAATALVIADSILPRTAAPKKQPADNVDGSSQLAPRLVWSADDGSTATASDVSPDGRYICFKGTATPDGDYLPKPTFLRASDNIVLHDLLTGKNRQITNETDLNLNYSRFSPDSKQLVYSRKGKNNIDEMYLVGVDGTGKRLLYRSEDTEAIQPADWSPNGGLILTYFKRKGTWSIALVSVIDGSVRIIKEGLFSGRIYFSPDGRYIAYNRRFQDESSSSAWQRDVFLMLADGGQDIPLVQGQTDDAVTGWTPDGRAVTFIRRRGVTADLWLIRVNDGRPQGEPELVSQDIEQAEPLRITRYGNLFYSVFLQETNIYTAKLDQKNGEVKTKPVLASAAFRNNTLYPLWSPDGRHLLFHLLPTYNLAMAILSLRDGKEYKVAHSLKRTTFTAWMPDGFILTLGADQQNRWGFYRVDPQTGETSFLSTGPEYSEELGYPMVTPDGKAIYYRSDRKHAILRRDLASGQEKAIYNYHTSDYVRSLRLSHDGRQLAFILYRDRLQHILVMTPEDGGTRELIKAKQPEILQSSYGQALAWTPDGQHIVYTRGREEKFEVWRIPVRGGKPQKMGPSMNSLRWLDISPDGQTIALSAGKYGTFEIREVQSFLPISKMKK